MTSPAECLANILQTAGVGHTTTPTITAWALKVSQLADTPDRCIALLDSGGFTPNPKWLLDFPTVQVIVRGPKQDYSAGYSKGLEVKNALLGISPTTVSNIRIDGITMLSDLTFIQYDSKDRPLFSLNFRLIQESPVDSLTSRKDLNDVG